MSTEKVNELKIKLYDSIEAYEALHKSHEELRGFVTAIVQLLEIDADESGVIKLETIFNELRRRTARGEDDDIEDRD